MRSSVLRNTLVLAVVVAVNSACTGLDVRLPERQSSERANVKVIPLTREMIRQGLNVRDDLVAGEAPLDLNSVYPVYKIGPGDVLDIQVPSLVLTATGGEQARSLGLGTTDQGYVVANDGTIYVPFAGVVKVGGQTLRAVQTRLIKALKEFIRVPQVVVTIREFRSQRVLIAGHVPRPGYQFLSDVPVTVVGGLSAAGAAITTEQSAGVSSGVGRLQNRQLPGSEGDYRRVRLSRDGKQYELDLADALERGDLSRDVPLQRGDVVYVPPIKRDYVFVLGQVREQSLMQVTVGRASLAEVLAASGGLNQSSADGERVYVIRGGLDQPVVYQLNADRADAILLADAFSIRPRDVIYVSEAGISKWNRFLRQLLPTVQTLLTGAIFAERIDDVSDN